MGPYGPTTLRNKADTTNVVLNEAHSNKVNGDFTIFKNSLIANECVKYQFFSALTSIAWNDSKVCQMVYGNKG